MKEIHISFKTARLAKEKGFNIECLHFYTKPKSKMFGLDEHNRSYSITNKSKSLYTIGEHATLNIENVLFAPTQSLLQKWIREIHYIDINIPSDVLGYSLFLVDRKKFKRINLQGNNLFQKYEEALEEGLYEALLLIEIKKDE